VALIDKSTTKRVARPRKKIFDYEESAAVSPSFETTATERLGKVEQRLDHIEGSIKRIEAGIDKVFTKMDDNKAEIKRDYEKLEERVRKMEDKWVAASAIIALIAFVWPALLKWFF
jgi:septation ring formation regulator EzrA